MYTVTPQDLLNGATASTNTNNQIQAQIQRMQSYVLGLMEIYQGPSAGQFLTLSEDWGADAKALNDVLTTIANGLNATANNYVVGETTSMTNINNIASTLPTARF
jgi:WXG100 family type VII secretion target